LQCHKDSALCAIAVSGSQSMSDVTLMFLNLDSGRPGNNPFSSKTSRATFKSGAELIPTEILTAGSLPSCFSEIACLVLTLPQCIQMMAIVLCYSSKITMGIFALGMLRACSIQLYILTPHSR
jgi:hypothetical protein